MEHKPFAVSVIAPMAVAAILVLGILSWISSTAAAQLSKTVKKPYVSKSIKMTFTAKLTGSNATFAPVNTPATGMARFELSSNGKVLNYHLSTTNLKGFKDAYICEKETLFNYTTNKKTGETCEAVVELSLGKGKITSGFGFGHFEDAPLSDLIKSMRGSMKTVGELYVEVNTQQHQNGEILGQIKPG